MQTEEDESITHNAFTRARRYFQLLIFPREIKNEITSVHDQAEVNKRSVQFVGSGLIVSCINLSVNLIDGHILSAWVTFLFSIFLGAVLFRLKKGHTKYTKTLIISGINVFLLLFNVTDGVKMGNFLYFFPLLFALPFLISSQNKYNRQILSYFILTVVCFSVCVAFFPGESRWQKITQEQYKTNLTINSICAFILSIVFSSLGLFFEKKYSKTLQEQKNRKEEAMKARSRFLSQMGHELRTPMNGILGAANLLAKQTVMPEQAEYLSILKYCSNHMLELINNIFDYNRIEAGELDIHLTEVNLKELLQNSVLPFYNRFDEKRVELKLELDDCLDCNVLVDEIRMIQILNNLLSNALKFTNNGYVKLKASCIHQEEHILRATFLVEDTGIGIAQEDIQKVFERFEQVYSASTRKYEGTGLGLHITQRLLNLMNSKLELESQRGKGSRFFFSIHLQKTDTGKTQQPISNIQEIDLSGMRVLIAEDNIINMLIARKILEGWNVTLTTAENGIEVLESLEINANYNLILMDLEMPEMDGYTAVREIRKLYPGIPVLAYTAALIDQDMYTDLKATGFVDAVLKPCQPLELFSKIRQYAN